ncbi:hypothetical protein ACFCXS_38135 [Streptomyces sp. NPDC056373]|uniref:hypothetical protein n=1 Tax=Streptomyces sp. NPDC056373 TaxID=3345798 RepID=UPI0035D8179B
MAENGWYDDADVIREAARARRVARLGMSVVTGLFGAVVITAAALVLGVVLVGALALAYAMAVMN